MSIQTERPARPIVQQNGGPTADEIIEALRAAEHGLEKESESREPFAALGQMFAARMKGPGVALGAPYATSAPFPGFPTLSPAASTPEQYGESDRVTGRIQLFAQGDAAAPQNPHLPAYRGRGLTAQIMTRIFTVPDVLWINALNVEVRCELRGNSVLAGSEGSNVGSAMTYAIVHADVLRVDDVTPYGVGSSAGSLAYRLRSSQSAVTPPVMATISLNETISFSAPAKPRGRYVVLVNVFAGAAVSVGSSLYAGIDFANRGSVEATGVWIPQIRVKY